MFYVCFMFYVLCLYFEEQNYVFFSPKNLITNFIAFLYIFMNKDPLQGHSTKSVERLKWRQVAWKGGDGFSQKLFCFRENSALRLRWKNVDKTKYTSCWALAYICMFIYSELFQQKERFSHRGIVPIWYTEWKPVFFFSKTCYLTIWIH